MPDINHGFNEKFDWFPYDDDDMGIITRITYSATGCCNKLTEGIIEYRALDVIIAKH